MPVVRRRERSRRPDWAVLDRMTSRHLMRGACFFGQCIVCRLDAEGLLELWDMHRERLLADYVRVHPGLRPWSWWQHDAPTAVELVPQPDHSFLVREPGGEWETELAYLARRGLLTPEEQAALAAKGA